MESLNGEVKKLTKQIEEQVEELDRATKENLAFKRDLRDLNED